MMKPSDFQKTIQCQFDCKLKRTVKGVIWNYKKELKRRKDKEIPFCELPEIVVEKLAVWDEYMSDYQRISYVIRIVYRVFNSVHEARAKEIWKLGGTTDNLFALA